jgi:radical SAM enzyme (TIGR01210 family)
MDNDFSKKTTICNQLLSRIGIKSRESSYNYWDDYQYAFHDCQCMKEEWGFIWFRTSGCINEKKGSCLYCKYGSGSEFDNSEIKRCITDGLTKMSKNYDILFASSAGSILDVRECSRSIYSHYLETLSKTDHRAFGFETRCETVNHEIIKNSQLILNNRLRYVFMGLETANQAALKYCLNKQQNLSTYVKAVKILREENVGTCSNIIVGTPFYSINERILLAKKSVEWAFENDSERVFLFPLNIKENTPLEVLFTKGLYTPPSLWELIEILTFFEQKIIENRIGISWYKENKDAFGVLHFPLTCDKCKHQVISLLSEFDKNPRYEIVEELNKINCTCRTNWNIARDESPEFSLNMLIKGYEAMASNWMDTDMFYKENKNEIISELKLNEGMFKV